MPVQSDSCPMKPMGMIYTKHTFSNCRERYSDSKLPRTNMSAPSNTVKLGTANINIHADSRTLSVPGWDVGTSLIQVYH